MLAANCSIFDHYCTQTMLLCKVYIKKAISLYYKLKYHKRYFHFIDSSPYAKNFIVVKNYSSKYMLKKKNYISLTVVYMSSVDK